MERKNGIPEYNTETNNKTVNEEQKLLKKNL